MYGDGDEGSRRYGDNGELCDTHCTKICTKFQQLLNIV